MMVRGSSWSIRSGAAGRAARGAAAAVSVVVAAGALAGCGGPVHAGSAATVGDTAISQRALEQRATAFLDSLSAQQRMSANGALPTVQTAILNEMVLERLVGDAAQQAGVQVSDAAVSSSLTQATSGAGGQLQSQLAQSYLTRDRLPDLLRVNLEVYAIGRKGAPPATTDQQAAQRAISYITDPARKLPVRVNPRYGTWQGVSITAANGSLSSVAPNEATASPSAAAIPQPTATPGNG